MKSFNTFNKLIEKSSSYLNNQRGLFIAVLISNIFFSLTFASIFALKGMEMGIYLSFSYCAVVTTIILVMIYNLTKANPNNFNGPQDHNFQSQDIDSIIKNYTDLIAKLKKFNKTNPKDFLEISILEKQIADLLYDNDSTLKFSFLINESLVDKDNLKHFYFDIIRQMTLITLEHKFISVDVSESNNLELKKSDGQSLISSNIVVKLKKKFYKDKQLQTTSPNNNQTSLIPSSLCAIVDDTTTFDFSQN